MTDEINAARRIGRPPGATPAVQARRDAIVKRFQPGASVIDVADAMHISYGIAYNDMRALNWPRNDPQKGRVAPNRKTSRNAAVRAVMRAEPERTMLSVAKQFSISKQRVHQIVNKPEAA